MKTNQEIIDAATPGPIEVHDRDNPIKCYVEEKTPNGYEVTAWAPSPPFATGQMVAAFIMRADAEFYAAARSDWPADRNRIDKLEAENASLRAEVEKLTGTCGLLRADAAEQAGQIARLTAERDGLRGTVLQLTTSLADANKRLAERVANASRMAAAFRDSDAQPIPPGFKVVPAEAMHDRGGPWETDPRDAEIAALKREVVQAVWRNSQVTGINGRLRTDLDTALARVAEQAKRIAELEGAIGKHKAVCSKTHLSSGDWNRADAELWRTVERRP